MILGPTPRMPTLPSTPRGMWGQPNPAQLRGLVQHQVQGQVQIRGQEQEALRRIPSPAGAARSAASHRTSGTMTLPPRGGAHAHDR
jgi:hypothetical protein